MDGPQVGDGMVHVDSLLVVLHKLCRAAGDCAVIHMDGNDCRMIPPLMCMEYTQVSIANMETKVSKGSFSQIC